MLQQPAVTWVTVEKPTFDLTGVVLGSFRFAGLLLVVAVALGLVFGAVLILSRRRPGPSPVEDVSLRLDSRA